MNRTKFVLMLSLLLVCGGFAFAAKTHPGMLDGKTFSGDSGEKDKAAANKETVDFSKGMFHSAACDQFGFQPAPYKTTRKGDAIDFESTTHSAKEGTIVWHGTVQGDSCDATLIWSKPGQPDIEYWFKGTAPQH